MTTPSISFVRLCAGRYEARSPAGEDVVLDRREAGPSGWSAWVDGRLVARDATLGSARRAALAEIARPDGLPV